jgi:hypothetical protein
MCLFFGRAFQKRVHVFLLRLAAVVVAHGFALRLVVVTEAEPYQVVHVQLERFEYNFYDFHPTTRLRLFKVFF